MGFEDSALTRLRRYREEADRSLGLMREAEDASRRFSERLFSGLEYTSTLAGQAGFEIETVHAGNTITLKVAAGPGAEAEVEFGLLAGASAETDEDLMHEDLSRYDLDPSGYSGRIIGFSDAAGEEACQTFAVYRDGIWKTKGLFVTRARGKVDDPDEVINGFCLRIIGRLVDLAATTGGAGKRWSGDHSYTLQDLKEGKPFPVERRFPR